MISGWLLAVALAGLAVYRAAMQSITYDEAFTYLAFLSGSPLLVFSRYTANNHVLFSVLARASIAIWGVSPFALRLTTVVFAVVFLFVTVRFAARVFKGYQSLLATAAMVLNPLVLDFMSAGRGYGVGLTFFVIGVYLLTDAAGRSAGFTDVRWMWASGVLGLAVCANLTFALPSAALIVVAGLFHAMLAERSDWSVLSVARTSARILTPFLVVPAGVLAVPLSRATPEHFSYGTDSLSQTMLSLVAGSFDHGRPAWPADPDTIQPERWLVVVGWVVGAFLVASCATAVQVAAGARQGRIDRAGVMLVLSAGTLVLSVGLLGVAHALLDVRYPFGRTGLYLIGLTSLALASLMAVWSSHRRRAARAMAVMLALLLTSGVVRYGSELTASYYFHWRFDAGTRDIVARLQTAANPDNGRIRVAVAELFAPSMEFYRTSLGLGGIELSSDRWFERPDSFDFFVVSPSAVELLAQQADVIFVHPVSGAVLMQNRGRPASEVNPEAR